jgi:hypothetical protein
MWTYGRNHFWLADERKRDAGKAKDFALGAVPVGNMCILGDLAFRVPQHFLHGRL